MTSADQKPQRLPPRQEDDDEYYSVRKHWDRLRNRMNDVVRDDKAEWAGAPMPLDDLELVIEPRYPYQGLQGAKFGEDKEPSEAAMRLAAEIADFSQGQLFPINSWYSWARDAEIMVYHTGNGRARVAVIPKHSHSQRLDLLVHTIGASQAWNVDAELKAMERLQTLIKPSAYDYYLLTGSFLESSPRSGVCYVFRRLRPTLAVKEHRGHMRVLAALCLHPIGYYHGSYAGVMVPTDDVIAHVTLMRGDEHKFWAKANQHASSEPEAGL